ncbi:MAG: hypothetical protein ABEJ07_03840 [Candidatus Nanohaloarchaea archaeon]
MEAMDKSGFLDLKNEEFEEIGEFTEFLIDQRDVSEFDDTLKVIGSITDFDSQEEFESSIRKEFQISKRYGNLLLLRKEYSVKEVESYVFFDRENKVSLFFTLENKTDIIPDTIINYIEEGANISSLWINPSTLDEIREEIERDYNNTQITQFVAKRELYTDIDSRLRPGRKRTIEYYGNDAKQTLKEMKQMYGVLPTVLEFRLPNNNQFRIDRKGIFTIRRGEFDLIFEIINRVLQRLLDLRDVVNTSGYQIVRTDTKNRSFEVESKEPWSIQLKKKIEYDDVPKIKEEIEEGEWGFTFVDSVAKEGSLYLSARIVDTRKNREIEIVSDGEEIKVYPPEDEEIGSSLRFFEFVQETIDRNAEAVESV